MTNKIQIGDIIEMPLPNGSKAYAQFVKKDKWGDVVIIYDLFTAKGDTVSVNDVIKRNVLIGPVITRIKVGIDNSQFNWKVLAKSDIPKFESINFIWKEGGYGAKNIKTKWYLYNGIENKMIGERLPQEYKSFEYLVSYSPGALVDRIIGNDYLERELIKNG